VTFRAAVSWIVSHHSHQEASMRHLFIVALTVVVFSTGASRAVADDAEAKAIITKAIDAHGGKEKLDKFKASKSKSKGVISIQGTDHEFTAEIASQIPDKLKSTFKLEINGMAFTVEQKVVGDKVGRSINGMAMDVPEAQQAEFKSALLQQKIVQLTPLLAKEFELKTITGEKVGDKETVGVLVRQKDAKDVKLFFDKSTHLLAKVERMGIDPTGNDVKQETFLSDYKEVQGVKRPSKTLTNNDGKKFLQTEVIEQIFLERLDEKEFAD
jgi:hypothetical protein